MLVITGVDDRDPRLRALASGARALVQLEALNAFADGLAHDLQQPITSITAFAQVTQRVRRR